MKSVSRPYFTFVLAPDPLNAWSVLNECAVLHAAGRRPYQLFPMRGTSAPGGKGGGLYAMKIGLSWAADALFGRFGRGDEIGLVHLVGELFVAVTALAELVPVGGD